MFIVIYFTANFWCWCAPLISFVSEMRFKSRASHVLGKYLQRTMFSTSAFILSIWCILFYIFHIWIAPFQAENHIKLIVKQAETGVYVYEVACQKWPNGKNTTLHCGHESLRGTCLLSEREKSLPYSIKFCSEMQKVHDNLRVQIKICWSFGQRKRSLTWCPCTKFSGTLPMSPTEQWGGSWHLKISF